MDRIDRILVTEQELTPGPDFGTRVMEAVRREADAPPIPFPWARFVVGFVVAPPLLLIALWWLQPLLRSAFEGGLGPLWMAAADPRFVWAVTLLALSSPLVFWFCELARTD